MILIKKKLFLCRKKFDCYIYKYIPFPKISGSNISAQLSTLDWISVLNWIFNTCPFGDNVAWMTSGDAGFTSMGFVGNPDFFLFEKNVSDFELSE